MILGLDLSLNGTGCCVIGNQEDVLFIGTIHPPDSFKLITDTPEQAIYKKIQWNINIILALIEAFDITEVAMEDYAFGAEGAYSNYLAENAGAIKQVLISKKYKINTCPIKSIKKYATGMGDADKVAMTKSFNKLMKRKKEDTLFGSNKVQLDDNAIDAYYVAIYFINKEEVA